MTYKINVGDVLPHFLSKDQEGEPVKDSDLIGGPIVIYFYPKDDTPGCTKEACSFRDHMTQFTESETIVIGVSPDSLHSHQKFIEKHDLNFTFLCDEKLELSKKFDVIRTKTDDGETTQKLERTTFVIDPQGVIRWIERPVKVEGHVERVLEAVKESLED